MQYKNNNTGEIITAYKIELVSSCEDYYVINLPEADKIIGLLPAQTVNYIPIVGDVYIDNGQIETSLIISIEEFSNNYSVN